MPIPLVGFANLAHMGAYHYMPSCFVKLSFKLKKKTPVIPSLQYEAQLDLPDEVFYVERYWCFRFYFRVVVSGSEMPKAWSSVEFACAQHLTYSYCGTRM